MLLNNELLFIVHAIIVSLSAISALFFGEAGLVAFVSIQCILANLFVIKQTVLFGFTATCADAFTIGAVLGLNLLQEYYGKKAARKAIWVNFFMLVFYSIMCKIHLGYTAAIYDQTHHQFTDILGTMPRIVVASGATYFICQWIDYYLYGLLKRLCKNRFLIARNYISIIATQGIDTILFSFLGLYGIMQNITEIMLVSYTIKLIAILISTPFVQFSKKINHC